MKTALISVATLLFGLVAGYFYGLKTGFVGGQAAAYAWGISYAEKYNAFRGGQDVASRDRLTDDYCRLMAQLCSGLYVYNPFYPVEAKVQQDLLFLSALYEANSQQAGIYPPGKRPALLPPNSPQKLRLEELIQKQRPYYDELLRKEQVRK